MLLLYFVKQYPLAYFDYNILQVDTSVTLIDLPRHTEELFLSFYIPLKITLQLI